MEADSKPFDALVRDLIVRWREDAAGTYRTWFLWEERLKNFRSIRRGLSVVVEEIDKRTFGTAYRESSLETVVHSIAEQRQMFRGADHAFLWKPKLRIPDIYENEAHQISFGKFLDTCVCCSNGDEIVAAIQALDAHKIKGLGPAAANLLYFLHPTLVVPSNTAIVKGYNALTGAKVKLGSWEAYLAMREGVLRLNQQYRALLSNDLGAIAGLLFEIGTERYTAPPRDDDENAKQAWEADLQKVRAESAASQKRRVKADELDRTHTDIQGWLRDLGMALGFDVWIASNDQTRSYGDGKLGDHCLTRLPDSLTSEPGVEAIRLIDVLWIERNGSGVIAAFEVEHTTSIYSGIVRMLDLAMGTSQTGLHGLFLVAPDDREHEVRAQMRRPAFQHIGQRGIRYLPYSELEKHRETIARFGEGMKAMLAISHPLS
ncbi:MAG: type II restriction endonuclease [Planctomycetales bacterium]|nr:type II restriction endonuclease [Planctomycetales bacterium]